MADERADLLAPCDIPDLGMLEKDVGYEQKYIKAYLALKVVVASKQQTSRHRRGDGGDAAENGLGLFWLVKRVHVPMVEMNILTP